MPDTELSRRALLGATAATGSALLMPEAAAARAPELAARPRVYLGTYTADGGHGLGVGALDPATGTPTVTSWLTGVPDPSWVDVSPDRRFLYTISESGGTVHAFRLDSAGHPAPLNQQPTGKGPAHVVLHPDGRHLLVSLYGGGAVVAHPVLPDGRVGPASDTVRHPGTAHAHQIVVDPSGRWLLAADLGLDSVYVYELKEGRFRQHRQVRLRKGAGPRHVVFHPGGEFVYVANELDSTVAVCRWRAGDLVVGQVLSTRPADAPGANYPGEIAISADGRFVYVSNRGDNTVAVLGTTGDRLRLLATPSCGGDWPRHLGLDATGRWLHVANQRSGDVTWFPLDHGLPGPLAGRLQAPAVAQVLTT
ncbi:3-carboxymuconate cyclase [Longispora fulva]|uniref:6-phosphogluconolactonase (Cycloisomerase 2 family) n=1 Tax=Longispora fulva TaxID=619741 RepID=A0A8J7KXE0_9ACTN|nr:lactonase family protein [Longispora fulva]MBG6137702.1 6-phosphogluconolactonase (cycloisomerase 2 family) [Longispora fulva]GIG62142.1 3-carboxymuconate cyclase [Longispora fulva]